MSGPSPHDTATDDPGHPAPVLDLVGIGFGPSNLGLGVSVEEHNRRVDPAHRVRARFLERQPRFGWHRGMLIADARMQVSFLKDLATLRDPTSSYSFLNYLSERGRLVDFLNRQSFFPTRLEFHDYLDWAAQRVEVPVDYATDVTEVRPARTNGDGPVLEVHAVRAGRPVVLRARNVVVATGLHPHVPDGVALGPRVWHNRDLVHRVAELAAGPQPRRCTVVGAGQSAAEAVEYLHRSFPDAEVCAVFNRYGYSPADDSGFANRVFDPAAAEEFFAAPPETRIQLMAVHRNTNYSVVDGDLIRELYERHYAERVAGTERLRFHKVSTVQELREEAGRVRVVVRSRLDGTVTELDSDVVVLATGYRSGDPTRFLRGLTAERGPDGRPSITRDYRLVVPETAAGVYVQGATEQTHGIGSTLLSNVAVRSGEILASVLAARDARRVPATSGAPAG